MVVWRSPKALLNCPLLSSSWEPSKPFKITAMDFYLHYNSTEYLFIHRTQLSEHFEQTVSTVGSTAPHNPHPVAEQALMRTVIMRCRCRFNMTTATPNTCLCPGPHSLKHITIHDKLSSQCIQLSYDSYTLVVYVSRRCLKQSLDGVLNTLLLRYHQIKKITRGQVDPGGLGDHSGS